MSSSSSKWERNTWSWESSPSWWRNTWQDGADESEWKTTHGDDEWKTTHGGDTAWQAGTWSPGLKRSFEQYQEGTERSPQVGQGSDEGQGFDEEVARSSKRLRPPRKVREYHKNMTKKIIEDIMKEKECSEGSSTLRPEDLPPPPPPKLEPAKVEVKDSSTMTGGAAVVKSSPIPHQERIAKAPLVPPTAKQIQAAKDLARSFSAAAEPAKKDASTKTVSVETRDVAVQVSIIKKVAAKARPLFHKPEGDERAVFNQSMTWMVDQVRLVQDELDSGLFLTATTEFMNTVIRDWKQIEDQLKDAAQMSSICVESLESWYTGVTNEQNKIQDSQEGSDAKASGSSESKKD